MKTNVVRNLLYGSLYFQFFYKNKNTLFEGFFVFLCFCVFVFLFRIPCCRLWHQSPFLLRGLVQQLLPQLLQQEVAREEGQEE